MFVLSTWSHNAIVVDSVFLPIYSYVYIRNMCTYEMCTCEIEKERMRYMRVMWNSRQMHERMRDFE